MAGGMMQLVAYGAQDVYLTGNPTITYFKVVYRRHTNFSIESVKQFFTGTADFGNTVSCLVSRVGDLVSGIYLEATLPELSLGASFNGEYHWIEDIGHHLIDQVQVEVGGQLIDRHYGDWLEIWAQLTVPAGQEVGYRKMIGQYPKDRFGRPTGLQKNTIGVTTEQLSRKIYVPLQFWFCRNPGLALPLIALQYHEVKVSVSFKDFNQLVIGNFASASLTTTESPALWVDYIYLDTDERRRFTQVSHEYLIDQLQFNGDIRVTTGTVESNPRTVLCNLNFNHPVKELIWVCQSTTHTDNNHWSNYTTCKAISVPINSSYIPTSVSGIDELYSLTDLTDYGGLGNVKTRDQMITLLGQSVKIPPGGQNPVVSGKLILNGHERFTEQKGRYFNLFQTYNAHTNVPVSPGINVYSFSLKPEEVQPSGTCNFSRIDSTVLQLNLAVNAIGVTNTSGDSYYNTTLSDGSQKISTTCNLKVYAVNYNIFRVTNGMGGIAYSN